MGHHLRELEFEHKQNKLLPVSSFFLANEHLSADLMAVRDLWEVIIEQQNVGAALCTVLNSRICILNI